MAESGQYRHSVRGASEEVKEIRCEPCQRDGQEVTAEGYCMDCTEYLCGQCYKSHRRNKMLSNHVLLDKDKMPTDPASITSVLDVCMEKCTSHPDKVIELYCENCNKVGCYICVSVGHRQCRTVQHIPDIATHYRSTLHRRIKSTADTLSKYNERLQAKITSNNKMKELATQEIKHQRAEINTIFDDLEKKMNDKITPIWKRNKDAMRVVSDKMDQIKKEFDQIKDDTERMRIGQNCGQFIAMMQHQDKITALYKKFTELEDELDKLRIQCYKLFPSEQILAMSQGMMGTTTEHYRMATASHEIQIDILIGKNTKPSIKCLTTVQGHYCVVVGKNNSNHSIMVIDTKSKCVTSETNTEAKNILSMTSVSDDKVAASVDSNHINFFTISSSGAIQYTNQQYVHDTYVDMVHHQGNIYGIRRKNNSIAVLSMTGDIIREIKTDDEGAAPFGSLQGIAIAVSPDGQTIYVTDRYSVTSLTLDGKVKAIYNNGLNVPWGITVDKYGYVYVHCKYTQSIHQLTTDLKMFQVLLEKQVPHYDGYGNKMTYSSTEHKLYINAGTHINQYSLDCYVQTTATVTVKTESTNLADSDGEIHHEEQSDDRDDS